MTGLWWSPTGDLWSGDGTGTLSLWDPDRNVPPTSIVVKELAGNVSSQESVGSEEIVLLKSSVF